LGGRVCQRERLTFGNRPEFWPSLARLPPSPELTGPQVPFAPVCLLPTKASGSTWTAILCACRCYGRRNACGYKLCETYGRGSDSAGTCSRWSFVRRPSRLMPRISAARVRFPAVYCRTESISCFSISCSDIGAMGVAGDETWDWPLPRQRIRSLNKSAPHGTSAEASAANRAISLSSSRTFPGKL